MVINYSSEMDSMYLDNLEEFINDEGKIVSKLIISRPVRVSKIHKLGCWSTFGFQKYLLLEYILF